VNAGCHAYRRKAHDGDETSFSTKLCVKRAGDAGPHVMRRSQTLVPAWTRRFSPTLAVLHDEGVGRAPGGFDRFRYRPAERRQPMGLQRAGRGDDFQSLPSAGECGDRSRSDHAATRAARFERSCSSRTMIGARRGAGHPPQEWLPRH
jgi:hypothetical protein